LQPAWYRMTSCVNGDTLYSTQKTIGTFAVGSIVGFVTSYFTIQEELYTLPPGSLIDVVATGFTTCPTTSTTTSTTTLPPLVVTNGAVTCSGGSGSFTSTFSGGTPPYLYTAADTSQVNLALKLDGSIPGRLNVTGNSQLFNLTPGSYYVGVVDSDNDTTINLTPVDVNGCITSTTTTTTTLPTYWYELTSCIDATITNSIGYYGGGFTIGQIVYMTVAPSMYFTITGSSTTAPTGPQNAITASGLTSCPTTTTTTTTAAPLPPVTFTYSTSCAGGEGTGIITITSITGGTGTGYQYSIQPTPGIWYNYPATNQLTGLANNTYAVAVRDSVGAGTSQFVGISCVTSTTTTTTTTDAPRYRYEKYDIDVESCMPVGLVTYAWSYQNVTTGYYSITGVGTFYLITASHTFDTNQLANLVSASCTPATTTTTTTPAPSNCTLWNFDNFSSDFGNSVTYTDCSGALTSVYVPELTSAQRCVQNGTTPVPGDTYIIVTNTLDPCT